MEFEIVTLFKKPVMPFSPEPIEALQARYQGAFWKTFNSRAVAEGREISPGNYPVNIFDFRNGLRLIVSRDAYDGGVVAVHVSASVQNGHQLYDELRWHLDRYGTQAQRVEGLREFMQRKAPARFRELSGDGRPLEYIGMSLDLIPHWFIREAGPGAV